MERIPKKIEKLDILTPKETPKKWNRQIEALYQISKSIKEPSGPSTKLKEIIL
jgi:hypothetical protein